MSYSTWHDYGYGIQTPPITDIDVKRLVAITALAPKINANLQGTISENGNYNDSQEFDDFLKYNDLLYGVASLLAEVIREQEKIEFLACDDYDGNQYLMLVPVYPWCETVRTLQLNEQKVAEVISKYLSMLTPVACTPDYLSVENGG